MRVKIVNPELAIGLKDPHTKRSPFLDPDTGKVILEANVPENTHWIRRLMDGSIVRVDERTEPVDNAPIPPLTTRGGR